LDTYGQVALKRVIDLVPMICRAMFREVPEAFRERLDLVQDGELAFLMQDSETFRSKRRELELEEQELQKGLDLFAKLMQTSFH